MTPAFRARALESRARAACRRHYGEGWREYEWRLRLPELGGRAPALPLPRWDGEATCAARRCSSTPSRASATRCSSFATRGRSLRAASHVLVQAPAALASLLATAPGVARRLPPARRYRRAMLELPLLSLGSLLDVGGRRFRRHRRTFAPIRDTRADR